MSTRKAKTKRGRKQDRARVAAGQPHEVKYAARKSGRDAETVFNTIKLYGNSRVKLMAKLEEIRDLLNMILPPKTRNIEFRTSGAKLVGVAKRAKKKIKRTR